MTLSITTLSKVTLSIKGFFVTLSITALCHYPECFIYCYADCHFADCQCAKFRHDNCRYAECRCAECHYPECRGAI
jgi:hypothetical protein